VDSDKGRLALELPAGTYSVAFVYRPLMLWPSVTLGLIGLVLALIVARFGRLILRAI
jgi:hypothetical protein